jgi:hypothetical protein
MCGGNQGAIRKSKNKPTIRKNREKEDAEACRGRRGQDDAAGAKRACGAHGMISKNKPGL